MKRKPSFRCEVCTLLLLSPADRTLFVRPIDTHRGVFRQLLFLLVRKLNLPPDDSAPTRAAETILYSRLTSEHDGWFDRHRPCSGRTIRFNPASVQLPTPIVSCLALDPR